MQVFSLGLVLRETKQIAIVWRRPVWSHRVGRIMSPLLPRGCCVDFGKQALVFVARVKRLLALSGFKGGEGSTHKAI